MAEGTEGQQTDDDMIIIIAQEIRKAGDTPTIDMAGWDQGLNFPAGTTARLLETAAEDAGYVVIRKGSTHASIARRQTGRITRA